MIVLFEIGLALLLLGIVANFVVRGRRMSMREAMTERRVEAYMQTIRREGDNVELIAMTDSELKDLLLASARNLRADAERRTWVLLGVCAVTLLAAIVIASQDGWRGFSIALLVGALAVYGLSEFLGRKMREPLIEKGIDAERLRVE